MGRLPHPARRHPSRPCSGRSPNGYVWIVLFVTVSFGGIGFFDDYKKLTKRSSSGLSGRAKLAAEIVVATTAALAVMHLTRDPLATTLAVPFLQEPADVPSAASSSRSMSS